MNAFDSLKERLTIKRKTQRDEYLELIGRADAPQPGDVETLATIMEALGISVDDAQSDAAILREFNALNAATRNIARLEKQRDEANAAWVTYAAKYQECRDEYNRLALTFDHAVNASNAAMGKIARQADIVRNHPHLFRNRKK